MAKLKIGKAVTEVADIKIDGIEAKTVSVGTEEITGAPEAKSITVGNTTYGISAGGSGGESPVRKVTGTINMDDDFFAFDVQDLDIFLSFVIENETQGWKICFTHPELVQNDPILSIVGFGVASGGPTNVKGLFNNDSEYCLNDPEDKVRFTSSVLVGRFGNNFDVEENDVITLTYYHTSCPYVLAMS